MTKTEIVNAREITLLEKSALLDDAKHLLNVAEAAVILDDAGYAACKSNERDSYVMRKTAKELEVVRIAQKAKDVAQVEFNCAEREYKTEGKDKLVAAGLKGL